jgi:integrase
MRTAFEIAVTLGWHYREVISLRVRQVDLAAGTVRLDPGSTKNGQGRECPMTPMIRSLLECISGKEPDDHVLTHDDGSPVRSFRATWLACCKEAGVEGLLFHDLRRTAARNLRNSGVAEGVIVKIGGRRTRSVFDRYSIVSAGDCTDALSKLERRWQAESLNRAAEQEQERPALSWPI